MFQISRKDFDGFKKLFHRFLQVKGPAIDWAKINRPPEDSVDALSSRMLAGHKHESRAAAREDTLDGGLNVIQLETAVGAAIKRFDNALGVNVPRSRFLPVKTSSDLLLVMSNLYSLDAGSLTMSKKREFPTTPHVKLGSSFTKVQQFLARFESIPDMLELDHLTVSGDVTFGKNVSLKGTVIIIANHGDRIDIPAGAMLENKI
ncbi:hypothetical protein INR49_006584, partial [Caranx melampygus]